MFFRDNIKTGSSGLILVHASPIWFAWQASFMADAVIRHARKRKHFVVLCWSRVSFSILAASSCEIFNFPNLNQEVYRVVK